MRGMKSTPERHPAWRRRSERAVSTRGKVTYIFRSLSSIFSQLLKLIGLDLLMENISFLGCVLHDLEGLLRRLFQVLLDNSEGDGRREYTLEESRTSKQRVGTHLQAGDGPLKHGLDEVFARLAHTKEIR